MSRPRLIALLLAFITLLVFLPVGQFGFVNYDDNDYLTKNAMVKTGLTPANIAWAFTTLYDCNWHPVTWLSHMLDCMLFGLNPGAHHFVNALFHAANAALLFVLLLRLTAKLWPAALIAALFAWHPLHVESVAWVSERKDVLSTFFGLLALLSYARYAKKVTGDESPVPGVRLADALVRVIRHPSLLLALLFFALGLMAKPMLVTLPCLLLLLDFWPLGRIQNGKLEIKNLLPLAVEKIPFFALTAASCVVTFIAQKNGAAVVSLANFSLRYRLENAPVAVVNYLLKLFYPTDLCAVYPMLGNISALQVTLAVAVLALISLAAWRGRNSQPYLLVGWLWFLGTLVPVIGLVQVGGTAMADRYTYIPSIGLFIAVVFLLADLADRLQTPKAIAAGVAALLLTGCILATEKQLPFWRDGETLFRRAIAVTRNNDIALVNLGVALAAQNRFEEALAAYRQAEKIAPERYQLHNNLGNLLKLLGRHEESLAEYQEAVRLRPDLAFLRNALGNQLRTLGRRAEAQKEFAEAIRLDPRYAQPHVEIALLLFELGRDAEAMDELRAALRLEPDNYQILATTAHHLAANENAAERNGRAALVLATKANALTGGNQPMVFDVLGMALAETGDFTNAQICVENALTLATAAQMKGLEPLHQRLELYRNRQPWRESFRATNAPAKSGGTRSPSP